MKPDTLNTYSKLIKPLLILVSVLVVVLLIYQVILTQKFHAVSTDPKTSNVATVSPFFKINFNKTLSKSGVVISLQPSIINSYQVQGKTLVINLNIPLNAGVRYYIKINNISDISGRRITNKLFTFIPQYVASQDLTNAQKQALLKKQSQKPPSKNNIAFGGTDALINSGLTVTQINLLEQIIFEYKPSAHTANINSSSVEPGPHDPNTDTSFTINFSLAIDAAPYNATISYSNLSTVHLYLYNPQTGVLMFDSNTPPASSNE
jgi:hypothetical protein